MHMVVILDHPGAIFLPFLKIAELGYLVHSTATARLTATRNADEYAGNFRFFSSEMRFCKTCRDFLPCSKAVQHQGSQAGVSRSGPLRYQFPVPVRGTVCGLPPPESLTETIALRAPVAVGPKVTEIVHDFPAATLVPQVFVCVKSVGFVPVMVILVMLSAEVPVLVSVTGFGVLLVPTF